MAHRTYTEEDQAQAAITLLINDGNLKRTARELMMPVATLRMWKTHWDMEGYPDTGNAPPLPTDALSKMQRLHDRSIDLLEDRIRQKDITSRDLVLAIKVITEKINMMRGLPSQRTETVHTFPSIQELQDKMQTYIGEMVDSAHQRQGDIIDAEVVELEPLALKKGD